MPYVCVLGFLTRFPQFRSRPLILASESYGGHCRVSLSITGYRVIHYPTIRRWPGEEMSSC